MVYLFLADGFEEVEALTPLDLLRRGSVDIKTVSIMDTKHVVGAHHIGVEADLFLEEITETPDMVILPGGMPGTIHLKEHEGLRKYIMDLERNSTCYLAAICAAPTVFGDMGLLEGKKATCYPGMEEGLLGATKLTDGVVQDGRYITSRGMGTAMDFGLTLLALLKGEQESQRIAQAIVYG